MELQDSTVQNITRSLWKVLYYALYVVQAIVGAIPFFVSTGLFEMASTEYNRGLVFLLLIFFIPITSGAIAGSTKRYFDNWRRDVQHKHL